MKLVVKGEKGEVKVKGIRCMKKSRKKKSREGEELSERPLKT